MILVTGGAGFIGSHTVRALVDQGAEPLVIGRRSADVPAHLQDLPVRAAQADVADIASLRALADHDITGIVHLAGYDWSAAAARGVAATRRNLDGLLNVIQVAEEWGVARVGVASTIGVYGGVQTTGALDEDMPVALSAPHPIPRYKKLGELLTEQLDETTDVEIVNYRISATWGPLGHEDPFFPAPALVHGAAQNEAPDLSGLLVPPLADDALDLCYVKDTGRAIALLQLTDTLHHRTYNVASGRATSNADVVRAIRAVVPTFDVDLPAGSARAHQWLDITRLHDDTGYTPEYDTERAAADYIAWLRTGNAN